jgi:hypothetical protein
LHDRGLEFVTIPIPDRGLPDDERALRQVPGHLHAALAGGRHVVVHCRAGIGRASLLAGALRVRDGLSSKQAWELLATAGACPYPMPTSGGNGCNDSQISNSPNRTALACCGQAEPRHSRRYRRG